MPGSSDARRLLAYLFVNRKRQARTALAGRLWPEHSESSARHALRQAIWKVNQRFPGLIESLADTVGLVEDYPFQVDAAEFEAIVQAHLKGVLNWADAARCLSQAAALYQGDLLDGYYDDWLTIERERLRELYLQALESLVVCQKATLRYEQALVTALKLAGADPLRETAHQEVMRLYHYLGRSTLALKQYQKCREIFMQELGLEPGPETASLAQSIARRTSDQGVPYLPEPGSGAGMILSERISEDQIVKIIPLVGRTIERDQLLQSFLQRPSGGSLVLVEGEAGVGKTRLLQETAQDVEWRGARVIWGRAAQVDTRGPYAPFKEAIDSQLTPLRIEQLRCLLDPLWLQVLQPVAPQLSEGLPDRSPLPALEAGSSALRLSEALGRLLDALSQISPLLVILEDLQWADEDTLAVLARLPGCLAGSQVLLIASYRGEEVFSPSALDGFLRQVPADSIRSRLKLSCLDLENTCVLLEDSLGGGELSPSFSRMMFEETRGNPLFLLEILRSLAGENVLHLSSEGQWSTPYDGEVEDAILPLPLTLEQVILHRLEQLPESLSRVIEKLAVFGDRFSFSEITCLEGVDQHHLVRAVQDLVNRRILSESPNGLFFRHEKIRQLVYESLPEKKRRSIHRQHGHCFERSFPGQVEALAYHFFQGQSWQKAYHYARMAASKAEAAFAFQEALAQLDRALKAAAEITVEAGEHFGLLCQREAILGVLGLSQEQERAVSELEVTAEGDASRLCEAFLRKSSWLANQGRHSEAETAGRQALDMARQAGSEDAQIAALIRLSEIIGDARAGHQAEAWEMANLASGLCQRSHNKRLAAALHTCIAYYLTQPGPRQINEEVKALQIYREIVDKTSEAEVLCALGASYQSAGNQHAIALNYYQASIEIARSIGYRKLEARLLNNMGNIYTTSQVSLALDCFLQSAEILKKLGDERRASVALLNAAQYRVLLLGDTGRAGQALPSIEAYARSVGDVWILGFVRLVQGQAFYQEGSIFEARQILQEALDLFTESGASWLHVQAHLAMAQVERDQGETEQAFTRLAQIESLADPSGWEEVLSLLYSIQASIRLVQGRAAEAEGLSAEAMARWTPAAEVGWIAPFVRCQVLAAQGKDIEAQAALEKAHTVVENLLGSLSPEERKLSIQRVPDYRNIMEAWSAIQAEVIPVRLPRLGAIGRGADREDMVEIRWTISTPQEKAIYNKVILRRQRLQRLIDEAAAQGAAPTIEHLAQALKVSPRTISLDMAALKQNKTG